MIDYKNHPYDLSVETIKPLDDLEFPKVKKLFLHGLIIIRCFPPQRYLPILRVDKALNLNQAEELVEFFMLLQHFFFLILEIERVPNTKIYFFF